MEVDKVDKIIRDVSKQVEKMGETKDMTKNILLFEDSSKKISECKKFLIELREEINNHYDGQIDENTHEIISDSTFSENLTNLEEIKKKAENTDDLGSMIALFKNASKIIEECKEYLENQKINIVNID